MEQHKAQNDVTPFCLGNVTYLLDVTPSNLLPRTHYHLHIFHFVLFRFKELVAKQHPTNSHARTYMYTHVYTHVHTNCMTGRYIELLLKAMGQIREETYHVPPHPITKTGTTVVEKHNQYWHRQHNARNIPSTILRSSLSLFARVRHSRSVG